MDFRKTIMAGVAACSVLTVLYGSDSSLQNIGSSFDRWVFECRPDGKKLRMPKIDANSYRSYLLNVKGDTIHMMHDDPDKETAYQGIFFTRYPGLTASGIVVAEWTAASSVRPEDHIYYPTSVFRGEDRTYSVAGVRLVEKEDFRAIYYLLRVELDNGQVKTYHLQIVK